MKPSGPGLLRFGSFFITGSISSAVTGLLRFSASSLFSFGRLYFSRNVSISLGFQISWPTVLHSNFLQFFVFLDISCSLPSFISDCVYLGPLSFFLDESA